jgi:Fe-S oxidoreductase
MKKTPQDLLQIDYRPSRRDWMDPAVDYEARRGSWSYPGAAKNLKYLGFANPRDWSPTDDDWKLPDNWQQIIRDGLKERLAKYRSLRVFLDCCVRCGACADKCHFFIGSGDPKNMPVLRAELLRSIYRNDFTTVGRILGRIAGGRKLTAEVLKEWYYYFFQCTECRRCSVFCPYGIDTAEITMFARELLNLVGLNINWVVEPVANCHRTGNHMNIPPHTFKDNVEFLCDELEETTGVRVEPTINRKGAEVLFIIPSADYFADPGIFTFMGYLMLFKHIGLDYTLSAYASEGGNFGLFTSHETIKRLNYKIYAEAKRLGVKWIIGGECGHMWRVMHQYMDTMNGPADFLEVPVSPFTGTRFEHAASTKMVHICEFTSDLIHHDKLKLDPSRNDHWRVTFHDSCNPSRALQPEPGDGADRGAALRPAQRLQPVLRDARQHHQGADLLLRRRRGAGQRREHGDEDARRAAARPRRQARAREARRQPAHLRLRDRPRDSATADGVLGARGAGVGSPRAGGQRAGDGALVMEGENERVKDLRGTVVRGEEGEADA